VELFGHPTNARFFKNWKFAPALDALPQTEAVIGCTLDVRMPLNWADADFDTVFAVLKEAIDDAGLLETSTSASSYITPRTHSPYPQAPPCLPNPKGARTLSTVDSNYISAAQAS
jgi:hypothetical protein